jgi:hypothetical protein
MFLDPCTLSLNAWQVYGLSLNKSRNATLSSHSNHDTAPLFVAAIVALYRGLTVFGISIERPGAGYAETVFHKVFIDFLSQSR